MSRTIAYTIAATTAVGLLIVGLFPQTRPQSQPTTAAQHRPLAMTTGAVNPASPRSGRSEAAWARIVLKKMADLEQRMAEMQPQANSNSDADEAPAKASSLTPTERVTRNLERIRRIDRSLENEPHDGRWSMDTSRALEELFVSVVPPGSSLSQTTCGETFCRLIVKHESRKARDEFEVFPRKVPGMGVRGLIEENADGSGKTTLYVVRKEYDTPEHPVRLQDSTG